MIQSKVLREKYKKQTNSSNTSTENVVRIRMKNQNVPSGKNEEDKNPYQYTSN
jgi:hypothetical protein